MVVLGVGAISLATEWPGSVQWTPDGLFYQAQSLEVRGESANQARQAVFRGPIGRHLIATDARLAPSVARELASAGWVRASSQHYRRRWLAPAVGAGLSPLFGQRSLQIASLLGFLVLAVFLYLLLVRRFSPPLSAMVAAIFMVVGPVRTYARYPLTDIWGVAMLVVCLYAALLVVDRGPRWLWLWAAAMAVLSLTRETVVVALVGVLWLALRAPRPRNLALLASGVAVTLPASLLLGGSLRANLAYNESGFQPRDSSWNYVVSHYWPALRSTRAFRSDRAPGRAMVRTSRRALLPLLRRTRRRCDPVAATGRRRPVLPSDPRDPAWRRALHRPGRQLHLAASGDGLLARSGRGPGPACRERAGPAPTEGVVFG